MIPTKHHDTFTHEQKSTNTIQNSPDPSDVTTNNQPSVTIKTASNLLDISVRQVTEFEHNTHTKNESTTLSTSNTNIAQSLSNQQASP